MLSVINQHTRTHETSVTASGRVRGIYQNEFVGCVYFLLLTYFLILITQPLNDHRMSYAQGVVQGNLRVEYVPCPRD